LRAHGLDVTLVHMGRGLFDQLGSPALSEELLALYRDRGVEVLLGEEVERFGGEGRVDWAATKSGVVVEADLVVVGVGVVPNVGFLDGSGVTIEDGVVVDETFRTNVAGVFAVGDVASFFDPLFGRRRLEHWSNASYQGAEVGQILAGRTGGYDTVSSFFSEVFGTTIKVFGDTSRFDELVEEGTLEDDFLASFGRGGRLVGAITVGQSEELEARIKQLIADRSSHPEVTHELAASVS
jgi:NADPH-dependent 2,4-dienoyl-CoA reductase/sulfur reductase-like enzyme